MLGVFLLISLIFMASLILRQKTNSKLCAICLAISLSWLLLLILYKVNRYSDGFLLGILMGQSITGLYYFGQKRLPKSLRIFTLPYFLTATAVVYLLITDRFIWAVFGLLTALWVVAWLFLTYRNDPGKKNFAEAAIDCCED